MERLGLFLMLVVSAAMVFAQTESARISGRVTDSTDAVIAGAECKIINIETNVSTTTLTNEDGIYVITDLRPATYRLTIQKEGFRTVVQPSLQLYVQDAVNENFKLAVGSVSGTASVIGAEPLLQTVSAEVSTVVNDQFVQNMPLNGRSFQSLIALVPGVVFTDAYEQFSVNGQRTTTNYFMVDGVSANFGAAISSSMASTISGSVPAWTVIGGTNGLVSVDAMQEFRVQTSSFAPEFGRTPAAKSPLSLSPARTISTAPRTTICETTFSMLATGSIRYRTQNQHFVRTISAAPSAVLYGRTKAFSSSLMRDSVCASLRLKSGAS
jgi:hypothetical protein